MLWGATRYITAHWRLFSTYRWLSTVCCRREVAFFIGTNAWDSVLCNKCIGTLCRWLQGMAQARTKHKNMGGIQEIFCQWISWSAALCLSHPQSTLRHRLHSCPRRPAWECLPSVWPTYVTFRLDCPPCTWLSCPQIPCLCNLLYIWFTTKYKCILIFCCQQKVCSAVVKGSFHPSEPLAPHSKP